jgi:phage shock protein A
MSIFAKARLVTLGSINDLLDKVIDLNSPSAVRQQVRDIEDAINRLSTDAAVESGSLRTQTREKSELESKIATDKATITKLEASTDPNAAAITRAKKQLVITEVGNLNSLTDQITNQTKEVSDLNSTVQLLNAKHDQLVARVRFLENLDRDTKSKEHADSAIKNVGFVLNSINNGSIDNLQQRMQARNDVANAKFEQSMGTLTANQDTGEDVDAAYDAIK